jgi:hypothetical protein
VSEIFGNENRSNSFLNTSDILPSDFNFDGEESKELVEASKTMQSLPSRYKTAAEDWIRPL